QIDKIVPVILIEVIIIDFNKSAKISTGIRAGLGENPGQTAGTVFPDIDISLSSKSINDILESFTDFGIIRLGKVVSPDFYMSLKLLENQGILNLRSTPKLSTLNGHEATLSIGNTEYYLEEQNQVIGTQNPQSVKTQTFKPVNAELAVTIKPIVSGDDQITLEIDVEQSDFTERISQFAPPGAVNRNFKSSIRVKNQEMVLLGGLEERRTSDSGSGLPLLSRIPVLKWIFSSKAKENSKSKLNIFIKPTIY
ncbi:MAG: type II and III secretion system protein, partial [Bacteroidales bacterium]|nr:type II and III secretion system protein [Bacteroidales bacterium]